MSNFFKRIMYAIFYYAEARKNFYPCRLTGGYEIDTSGKAIVEVKNFGNGKFFFAFVRKIFDDSQFLEKFSPHDASRITMAAYNEIFFSIKEEEREEKMKSIISSSFDEIKKKEKSGE